MDMDFLVEKLVWYLISFSILLLSPPFPFPILHLHFLRSFYLCYASQLEEECWKYYKLLRLCHAYVITVYRTMFYISPLLSVCLRAHQAKPNISLYYCLLCSVLSTCQHLPVPTPLFSTQTDLPVAGSLQLVSRDSN